MGLFDLFLGGLGAANDAKNEIAELQKRKLGKSPQQQRVIDFFYTDEATGCLSKKNGGLYTMAEYQDLVRNTAASLNIKNKALAKIGLDESEISEISPIVLSSYVFDDNCRVKIKNGEAVTNQFSISWIFFSATQLYTYTYIFDMMSDDTWEFTRDYFYSDITTICTQTMVKEKIDRKLTPGGCLKKEHEDVTKNNYTVDRLEIVVPGSTFSLTMRNSTNMERSIQAAKAMIREKKYVK